MVESKLPASIQGDRSLGPSRPGSLGGDRFCGVRHRRLFRRGFPWLGLLRWLISLDRTAQVLPGVHQPINECRSTPTIAGRDRMVVQAYPKGMGTVSLLTLLF